eukprot:1333648-Amorphochlora_amoeboformis.AAC.1
MKAAQSGSVASIARKFKSQDNRFDTIGRAKRSKVAHPNTNWTEIQICTHNLQENSMAFNLFAVIVPYYRSRLIRA